MWAGVYWLLEKRTSYTRQQKRSASRNAHDTPTAHGGEGSKCTEDGEEKEAGNETNTPTTAGTRLHRHRAQGVSFEERETLVT